jgi:hypothetical protein
MTGGPGKNASLRRPRVYRYQNHGAGRLGRQKLSSLMLPDRGPELPAPQELCRDRGVASIGFGKEIYSCGGTKGPMSLLTRAKDKRGVLLGSKSTMLEGVGPLIPFSDGAVVRKNMCGIGC